MSSYELGLVDLRNLNTVKHVDQNLTFVIFMHSKTDFEHNSNLYYTSDAGYP